MVSSTPTERDEGCDVNPITDWGTDANADALRAVVTERLARRKAEARLDRAVGALREIEAEEGYGESPAPIIVRNVREIARAALAEIQESA